MNVVEAWLKAEVGQHLYRTSMEARYTARFTKKASDLGLGGSSHAFLDAFVGSGDPGSRTFDFWMLADDWEVSKSRQKGVIR